MENLTVNPENYKILVVDDIATNILLLKAILGRAKYRIVTATGGREALEKVESESPDLILLDIMMPDMNGYEVIERLKADERFCRIPVIFLSALHDSENIVKGFKMGASDYVSKPFNHEELITRVAHHMFIAEAQRVIVRQNEELQATLASRDKMYSVIAHDLRSPIGSLKMLFNTLLDSLDAERVGAGNLDMLRMGNDIAEDTFSLLDNLLKWTKCQTGRMHTVYQDVDLAEVVLFSSKISESVARTKGIVVEYDIPAPIHVRCDVDMVKTIVRNLLSNAIKYSPEGGGKIIVSTAETPTLYMPERAVIAMFITNHIAGRVPLVMGCGGNSTSEVLDQLREFDLRGADAILSVTPYYNKPSQEGLYQHFRTVSEHSPLPVILYNIPGRSGVNMTAETCLLYTSPSPRD